MNIVGRKMGNIRDCDNVWKPAKHIHDKHPAAITTLENDRPGYIYLSYRTPDVLADSLQPW